MTGYVKSPYESRLFYSAEQVESGRRMAAKTARWMEAHEDAFVGIYGFLKSMQLKGIKGRVRDRVAVFCTEQGIKVGDSPYNFNNTWWAGISRYLVLHDGSLFNDPISFRDSDIDACGLLPVSYLPETQEVQR